MTDETVIAPVARYYADKLAAYGTTPQGVDWSSEASQQLRFSQLLRVLDHERGDCTVLDYGCGYGALAQRLIADRRLFRYTGFDICTQMVDAARATVKDARCVFSDCEAELPSVDYTIASGIFNVRLGASDAAWHEYVASTIAAMTARSHRGIAFNMLTRYADRHLMRSDLYYGEPERYFRLCKERWSRDVALLHDYELYEFTVLVRLGNRPTGLCP